MSTRKTEADLKGQVDRLNRNMGLNETNDYFVQHANGYINLMKVDGKGWSDVSLGNTKTELYWQLVVANKVFEEFRRSEK